MSPVEALKDPYNIIVTGVGGQGNVMGSRILGNMLVAQGFQVTIGETFGASQRGGSVMSHVRVSSSRVLSPQMPKGIADVVVSLEPIEAFRVLKNYGNPQVKVLTNTRPNYPTGVNSGELEYPSLEEMKAAMATVSAKNWFIDASEQAVALGSPILANIILIGALAGLGELPLFRADFEQIVRRTFPAGKVDMNLKAFDIGLAVTGNN